MVLYTATADDYGNKNIKILTGKQGQLDRFSYEYFQQGIQ